MRNWLLSVVLIACALGATAQQQVDKSKPIDFNGSWIDDQNREWVFNQDGTYLTIRAHSGATFEGQITGREFSAFHILTYAETDKDLPVPIRQKIAGEQVSLEGSLDRDGEYIYLTYIDKDPQWKKNEDTGKYEILEMRNGRKQMTLKRPPDIHIGRIRVDYDAGQQRVHEIQQKINDLDTDLQALDPLIKEAQDRYSRAQGPYDKAKQIEAEIRAQIPKNAPDPNLQLQIDYLNALKFYQDMADAGANASNKSFVDAVNQKNALLKQLKAKGTKAPLPYQKSGAQLQAMIDALEKQQGVSKDKVAQLEDQALVAHGEFEKAQFEWDLAIHLLNRLNDEYTPKKAEKKRLEDSIADARRYGDPQLTEVDVTGPDGHNYNAKWWDPSDGLKLIDDNIAQLDDVIAGQRDAEQALHAAYDDARREEAAAGDRVVSGIWKSAWAQYGLEALDFLGDVVKNSKEEGFVIGGAHAVFKKVFDMGKDVVWAGGDFKEIGGYDFLDGDQIRQEMLQGKQRDDWPDAKDEGWEAYQAAGKEFVNTMSTKELINNIPNVRSIAAYCLLRSRHGKDMAAIGAKRAMSGGLGAMFQEVGLQRNAGDMAFDAFKDYAKNKLKQGARETFEGTAWREYFNAEFYRMALHHQWGGAVVRLRAVEKLRAQLQFTRDGIIRDYQQNDPNYYNGKEDAPLKQRKTYTVRLKWKGATPKRIEVHFGNALGRGDANTQTFDTARMKGTYDLYVKVLEY